MDEEEDLLNPNKQISNDESISQKHSAMIERLTNLHQSRLQQQEISHKSDSNSSPSFESTKSFLDRFSSLKQSIETELDRCRNVTDRKSKSSLIKSDLEKVLLSISNLEKLVAENSYFLPNYEVRSSLKTISDLKEKLELVNSELLPKKKFAFKSKSKTKEQNKVVVNENVGKVNAVDTTVKVRDSPGFRDKEGVVLIKHFGDSEEGEFTLENLNSCEIRLIGRLRALFVHKLKNCRVFVGPIMGSVLIEQVEDCLLMLASHQIRIHHAKKTDFYLRVRSRPIIEDSNGVRFAPYLLVYDGIENDLKECSLYEDTGNWGNVDDFRWLRAVQSPNWSVLPEEERNGTVDISKLETSSENS
ncbi:Tubulin-specific chaperone c [Thalictrum thalictroides]|uniref:Tubulin-specific chaperone c n=1 Tax=Thalictrum thalictroides TaxID=46969 RepID=A0A7J6X7Y5_THATH|nr:Tubulin-specific chaperone c [Thalictrum thalictroides]